MLLLAHWECYTCLTGLDQGPTVFQGHYSMSTFTCGPLTIMEYLCNQKASEVKGLWKLQTDSFRPCDLLTFTLLLLVTIPERPAQYPVRHCAKPVTPASPSFLPPARLPPPFLLHPPTLLPLQPYFLLLPSFPLQSSFPFRLFTSLPPPPCSPPFLTLYPLFFCPALYSLPPVLLAPCTFFPPPSL